MLSKVHSRPVEGNGIELERIGSLKPVVGNPILQQAKNQAEKEDRDQQSTSKTYNYGTGNRSEGDDRGNGVDNTGTTSVDVDVDLDVDESLFDAQGKVAMTRAPSVKPAPPPLPLNHMSTSPAALPSGPKPDTRKTFLPTIPSFKPKAPTAPTAPTRTAPMLTGVVEEAESVVTEESMHARQEERASASTSASTSKEAIIAPMLSMATTQEQEEKVVEVQSNGNGIVTVLSTKNQVEAEEKSIMAESRASSRSRIRAIDGSVESQTRGRKTLRSRSVSRGRGRDSEGSVSSGQSKSSGKQTMQIYGKDKSSGGVSVTKAIGNYFRSRSRSKSRSSTRPGSTSGGTGAADVINQAASSSKLPIKRQLLPPSYDSAAPKSSVSTVSSNQNTNSQSESAQEIDNEPGVIWVRSFSSRRGGSVFVGKDAAARSGRNADEDGSLMSADSQELYALRKLHGFQDIPKTKSTASRGTAISKDNDVSSVVSRGTEVSKGTADSKGTASTDASKSIRTSQTKSIMPSRSKHSIPSTIAEDSDEGSEDVFDQSTTGTVFTTDQGTVFTADQTALDEELESSESDESDDSDDEMTMDTYANFTVGDDDDDSEDSSDDEDEFSDDGSADTEALALGISSVAGGKSQRTVKTTVSDVSGSFDDDEVLGNGDGVAEDIMQEPIELEKEIQKKKKAEREAKKKKRVFKMGTGLGKKKGEMKTVKTETKKTKISKRGILGTKKVKTTKMKTSGVRVPKKKVIKKKRGVQLRTIRINGQLDQDDIVPRKGDPGVKGEFITAFISSSMSLCLDDC